MTGLSTFDHSVSPPRWTLPREFNAAYDFIERNLQAGRGGKVAYIHDSGRCTYDELAARVNRSANVLAGLGIPQESRVMLCMLDTIEYPAMFLGAIKAGIVPIATNTLLTPKEYAFMLRDSRARALVVSEPLYPVFEPLLDGLPHLEHVIVCGSAAHGRLRLSDLLADASDRFTAAETCADDMCFWLYTSGSTGAPKGTVHLHSHLVVHAELYARGVLGLTEDDVTFSAPKLFFAYGLGASLAFPLTVGATAVLMAERPTPDGVFKRLRAHRPTVFYAVPTLYAALLAAPNLPRHDEVRMRMSISAGEALSAGLANRWRDHFGTDILDGLGSTEMTHIFMSNRPGDNRPGTSGKPVPGYAVRIADEQGRDVTPGEIGDLYVAGPTSALMYWNNRERTKLTFQGPWTRSGDKYYVDEDGYYVYAGRSDDMLKVSGQYVSPFEVEAALMSHASVLEAAVVGVDDENQLTKPWAYVVLKEGIAGDEALAEALKAHVKAALPPHKYPRRVVFMGELPKTATGKIQRFRLRELAAKEASAAASA
jgi:benzoate-CoA ligase